MSNTKDKLLKLVEELSVSESVRTDLRKRIESEGVSKILIDSVRQIIDDAIIQYQEKAQEEIKKLQTNLEETVNRFEKEFTEIEDQAHKAVKEQRHKQDQDQLEEVRKKLQST